MVASGDVPPADPGDGEVYRVIASASGDWTGEEDSLAISLGGSWHFVQPTIGMRIYDQAATQWLVFTGQWETASVPSAPTGGSVIDVEARATIDEIVVELSRLGILS